MKKKSVISLRTQSVNLGDYLILVCSINYLLSRYGVVTLDSKNAPSAFVAAVEDNYQDEIAAGRIEIRSLSAAYYVLNAFDFFRKAGALSSSNSLKAKFSYVTKAGLNKYRRMTGLGQAYLFPISIAGTLNRASKLFFNSFKHILVRDPSSLTILQNADIRHVRQVPDMSHYMFGDDVERVALAAPSPKAAISFRYDRSPSTEQLIHLTKNNSFQVTHVVTQVLYDADVNEAFAAALNAPHYVSSIDTAGIEAVNAIYAQSDIVVSNRLHVLLLGMLAGAVPVPVVHQADAKVIDYFSALGFTYVSIEQLDSKEAFAHVVETNSQSIDLVRIKQTLESGLNACIE